MTQDDAPSAVEQVDRDAAAAMLTVHAGDDITTWQLISKIKAGEADSATTVQALARHRQAALAEAAGIAREIGRNPDWQSPIARETVRCAAEEIAEAILAAAGRSAASTIDGGKG